MRQSLPTGFAGHVSEDGSDLGRGASFNDGNRVGIAVDLSAKLFWFRVNGGNWNGSGSANPATGTGGLLVQSERRCVCDLRRVGNNDEITANFGATAFTDTIPSGFTAWG